MLPIVNILASTTATPRWPAEAGGAVSGVLAMSCESARDRGFRLSVGMAFAGSPYTLAFRYSIVLEQGEETTEEIP